MTARTENEGTQVATDRSEWQVVVAYEDEFSRDRAMRVSQSLNQRFAGEIIFSFTWWRFRYLEDQDIALVARHYASAADIIIFSTRTPGLFALPVMNWIESWTAARRKRFGLLVPLVGSPNIPSQLFSTKQFYLRHVADRAGMDFLPQSSIEHLDQFPISDRIRSTPGVSPGRSER
jgi:hypothetical protein